MEDFFMDQIKLVFKVQQNKRRGRDSLIYENNIIALTVRGMYKRLDRTLLIEQNYAFLVSLPKWREIMATEFEGRKIDHEICDYIIPFADEYVLSPYTFNNRKGKGSHAAIWLLISNIEEVTENYTKPARCIKIDFKGYFPNALWSYAEKVICDVINQLNLPKEKNDYLVWLTSVAINCNPAEHCVLRSPLHLWTEHIDPEKSILNKPKGIGAAIGRLIWQTAMGLYINDIIKELDEQHHLKVVCFVDDIVLVFSEEQHLFVLSLIPKLREKLKDRNVKINENKFYDLPCYRGLEFLGSHIKPHRIHLNNSTYNRAKKKIIEFNNSKYKDIDAMVSTFNSYTGLLKNRNDYKRIIALKDMIDDVWWNWLYFNNKKLCLGYKPEFSVNTRLNDKYNLKLKNYDPRRNYRIKKHVIL